MKGKTYQVEHACVCTRDKLLIEGAEYLLKEGSHKDRIVLEEVVENGEWLKLKVRYTEENRRIEISHLNVNYGYSGMWRIYDWEERMQEEIEEAKKMREEFVKNFKPEVKHSKEAYISSLSEDMRVNILIHFNKLCQCNELGEREYNMVWLAWIVGEGMLLWTDDLVMFEMGEIEFDHKDYELTCEPRIQGKSNIDSLREYYLLDNLYNEVLKSR